MTGDFDQQTMWAAGLMCGTSLDGIDVAIVRAPDLDHLEQLQVVAHDVHAFREVDSTRVRAIAGGESTTAEELSGLRFALSRDEEHAVRALCERVGVEACELDYVAAHGITLCHRAAAEPVHGWQLHAGAGLAARLGCAVIDEFRAGDMALGGQGAPLAPLADFALRRSEREDRAILNLGGVANATLMRAGCDRVSKVVCGDVGPANLPLDWLARTRLGQDFDRGGAEALRGQVDETVRDRVLDQAWVRAPLPRSFGREEFGPAWVREIEEQMPAASVADRMATLIAVEVGALKIFFEEFAPEEGAWHCYLTGGGRHNLAWIELAGRAMPSVVFDGIEALGVHPDAKEAVDFAYLGGQARRGRVSSQSALTGARGDLVLGALHLPRGEQ